jgi:hypothetical protein
MISKPSVSGKKTAAKDRELVVKAAVRDGVHTAHATSTTVAEAGEAWLRNCADLEKASQDEYRRLLDLHIKPYLGDVKLSKLTAPMVVEFRTKQRWAGCLNCQQCYRLIFNI